MRTAQIIPMQLDKRILELFPFVQFDSKFVCLVFVPTGDTVHAEFHHRVERGEDELEEHKADNDRLRTAGGIVCREIGREAECGVEGGVVDKDGKYCEGEEEVGLRDEEELAGVGCMLAMSPLLDHDPR